MKKTPEGDFNENIFMKLRSNFYLNCSSLIINYSPSSGETIFSK
jgi:hypothetical protein